MRGFCALVFSLVAVSAAAQDVDTTAWRAFFPLEIGNEWQYSHLSSRGGGAETSISYSGLRVVADTVADGKTYFVIAFCSAPALDAPVDCGPPHEYVRYRSTDLVEFTSSSDGQTDERVWRRQPCGFSFPADSTLYWACNSTALVKVYADMSVDIGSESLTGVTVKRLFYGHGGTAHEVMFAEGIGRIQEHQNSSGYSFSSSSLEYARVGGTEYGTSVYSTAGEGSSLGGVQRPPRATLSVLPNPTLGSAAAVLNVPADGAVRVTLYDMMGREVDRVFDGSVSAGEHRFPLEVSDLAPGVYVARALGATWFTTTRVVVG